MGRVASQARRGGALGWKSRFFASRKGAGFLVFIWFPLMLASVGLMYYYYLKSQRLERELQLLREKSGIVSGAGGSQSSPQLVVADGVAPETFAESREATSTISNLPSPLAKEGDRVTAERGAMDVHPTPSTGPTPTPAPVVAAPTETPKPTPLSGHGAGAGSERDQATRSSANSAGPKTPSSERVEEVSSEQSRPKPRSTTRAGRINSVYDLQQQESKR